MGLVSPCCSETNDRAFGKRGVVLKRRGLICEKFERLQKIVPGGEGLKEDQLMAQTADYILHLRTQLSLLQALLKLHDDDDTN